MNTKQWENKVIQFLNNNNNELVKFDHEKQEITFRQLDFDKAIYTTSYEKLNYRMDQMELTPEQQETLNIRLQMENVKPIRLYKSNTSNSILFESININLNHNESFYFIITEGGTLHGKGYNFEYLNQYSLIYSYDEKEMKTA